MYIKIISVFLTIGTIWASTAIAHELTPEFCRKSCEGNQYTGWCFPLGSSAKKISAPFNAILAATSNGDTDFKLANCNRKIVVMGSNMTISGNPCSLTQVGADSDTKLTSEISGTIQGTISNENNFIEVKFTGGLLKSGFKTSQFSTFGKVSFVTTYFTSKGEQKVIWDNSEFCFAGFVNP